MDFWNESLLPEIEEYDNLVILKTCSKALGLAGLRLGFAVAGKTMTRALRAVKSPYNVGLLPQAIASAVLEEPDYLQNCVGQLIASRTQLQAALDSLSEKYPDFLKKVYPSVTNFVLIVLSESRSDPKRTGRGKDRCPQISGLSPDQCRKPGGK